jgi:hypothetical protein
MANPDWAVPPNSGGTSRATQNQLLTSYMNNGDLALTTRIVKGGIGIVLCVGILFQSSEISEAMPQFDPSAEYSQIEHGNGSATLSVFSYGRPLLDGLIAFREEYGTKIYLEQRLCYEAPGGQKFETTYPEKPTVGRAPSAINWPLEYSYFLPDSSVERTLNKIVSDYNQSGPACRYSVTAQSDGSYVVSMSAIRGSDGTYQPVTPLLDTPISIPAGVDIFEAVGKALSAASGLHVVLDMHSDVLLGAQPSRASNGPARTLIHEAVPHMVWDLYCVSRGQLCVVNLEFQHRAEYDNLGRRRTLP